MHYILHAYSCIDIFTYSHILTVSLVNVAKPQTLISWTGNALSISRECLSMCIHFFINLTIRDMFARWKEGTYRTSCCFRGRHVQEIHLFLTSHEGGIVDGFGEIFNTEKIMGLENPLEQHETRTYVGPRSLHECFHRLDGKPHSFL